MHTEKKEAEEMIGLNIKTNCYYYYHQTSLYYERCSFINFPTDLLLAIAPHRCIRQANVLLVTVNEKILFHLFSFFLLLPIDCTKYGFLRDISNFN